MIKLSGRELDLSDSYRNENLVSNKLIKVKFLPRKEIKKITFRALTLRESEENF